MDFTLYLPATTFAAVWCGALLWLMTAGIGVIRNRRQISYGDAGDARFAKRQRGHSNGVEQIPITLILLTLAEVQGASGWLVWGACGGLILGRSSHAIQFWFQGAPFVMRPFGVVVTLLAQLGVLVWLIGRVVF